MPLLEVRFWKKKLAQGMTIWALPALNYTILTANIIAAIICIILLLTIWYYWYAVGMKVANRTIMVLSMAGISLYCLSSISLAIGAMELIDIVHISDIVDIPLWSSSQICTYLVFTNRFKISFKDTKYALPNKLYLIYYIMLTIYFMIHCAEVITYILVEYTSNSLNNNQYLDYFIAASFSVLFIDLFLSISLLWTFLHKLIGLHIDIGQQSNARYKQNAIIHVMSKMNILTTISVLSSQVFVIFTLCLNTLHRFDIVDLKEFGTLLKILFSLWAFENVINAMCIYLSFEFAAPVYDKLCRKMHYCCVALCVKWTRKRTIEIKINEMKQSLEVPFLNDDGVGYKKTITYATSAKSSYQPPLVESTIKQ